MKLTRIRPVGRYVHKETKQAVNIHTGRVVGRSVDVMFYYYQQKRMPISDRDFYENWKKEETQ